MIDYQVYLHRVDELREEHIDWRYGQTLMNVLREMEPTLYDRITDTDADVFYCTRRNDERFSAFWTEFWKIEA